MKWHTDFNESVCQLSSHLQARVSREVRHWIARVVSRDGHSIWVTAQANEAAAKSAVAAWIGKTIAQLGNALAAGEPRVDEE